MTRKELKELLQNLKRQPCADCKQCFDPVCIDFDHVPEKGEKIAALGHFIAAGDEAGFFRELVKGEFVCSNCHRLRTKSRPVSASTRRKLSDAAKVAQTRPEQRERLRTAALKVHADPAMKAIYSQSISRGWKKRRGNDHE
jgi:hypothetical protein